MTLPLYHPSKRCTTDVSSVRHLVSAPLQLRRIQGSVLEKEKNTREVMVGGTDRVTRSTSLVPRGSAAGIGEVDRELGAEL